MSELEISSVKYPALKKWGTLGNKADGVESLLKITPTYEALVNSAVQEYIMSSEEIDEVVQKDTKEALHSNSNSNRPFFTGNGKAERAVRSMQKVNDGAELKGYER